MINRVSLVACVTAAMVVTAGPAAAAEIYLPNLSYRTGPFAATGIPLMNGQRDYITLLNERDGGVGGIRLGYDECETGYSTAKGVECYERTKSRAVVTQPWSTGITLQVLPKTNVDNIPLLAPGYGFSPMANGEVFAWAFNPPASYWDAASMILNYISDGNLDSLKGKKIAHLHLDHPYGKEPLTLLEELSKRHGFTLLPIPVGIKEMQNQSAQWLQIRKTKPDWVLMWGWGAMNAGAVTEAVKTRFPMDRFIGVWWSGRDGDLRTVGARGKGYKTISWNLPTNAPVIGEIRKHVVDKGMSLIKDASEMNTVFYQRGIVISMILVEAIRTAQAKYKTEAVNARQLRWGLENLNVTEARLKALGMEGMTVPIRTTCQDHSGHTGAWMLQWDGEKFNRISGLLKPQRDVIEPLEREKSAEYAKSNAPWPGRDKVSCDG